MIAFVCTNAALGLGVGADAVACAFGDALVGAAHSSGIGAASMPRSAWGDDAAKLSATDVLSDTGIQQFLRDKHVTAIAPFKTNRRLPSVTDLPILACDAQLIRGLENKLALSSIASDAGVAVPRTQNTVVDEGFADAVASFSGGDAVVFQPAVGYAGKNTVLIESADEIALLHKHVPRSAGKLCEYVAGDALTVNGVVVADDNPAVLVGDVSTQLLGIPGCTLRAFSSCGNDYSVDSAIAQAVREVAAKVGHVLLQRGFRGAFGIDAVASRDGSITLIEVNPRFTASFSLAIQLQQSDAPTLWDAHCLAFGHSESSLQSLVDLFDVSVLRSPAQAASTLLMFNNADSFTAVPDTCIPGIWSARDMTFQRSGVLLSDIKTEDEFLLLAEPGRQVSPGTEMLRMMFASSVTDNSTTIQLRSGVRTIVDDMQSQAYSAPVS